MSVKIDIIYPIDSRSIEILIFFVIIDDISIFYRYISINCEVKLYKMKLLEGSNRAQNCRVQPPFH